MARRVKDRNLDSRDARGKLKPSGKPYWRAIGKCLHIGYRKGKTSGVWVIRRYLGNQTSGPGGLKTPTELPCSESAEETGSRRDTDYERTRGGYRH